MRVSEAGQRPVSEDAAMIIMAIWIFGAAILGWIFLLAPTEPGHGASLIAFDVWQRKFRCAHWNRHSQSWASTMSACAILGSVLPLCRSATCRPVERRSEMSWKTPKIIEVPVGMEINMYACAARK
jgi:coenzyme PQQ precursor peptide PqqA